EAVGARTGQQDRRDARPERQRELEAVVTVEEAAPPMGAADDHDALADEDRRREWRQQAEREPEPARELRERGDPGEQPCRAEAHVAHRSLPAGEPRSLPPAEQLLGAMYGE